ncbi:hypothetical protein [Amycolatopsis sp. H20-H5]|uniref:hypothetical protein n=1 Tax=Amycolatopsis sp. H20-H5 TaxID=3046309 RepID=UPI002DB7FF94|nr:hypothetical protein [Amycolatopsis sp. H20-H5]MEC3977898.1 hypothetical protein [Amycolatopsis sp. H20-H5]
MSQLGTYKGVVRDGIGWLNSADRPDPTQVFHRANLPRVGLDDEAALSSGVMTAVAVWLNAGDLVTSLSFISGGTALAGGTNHWFALYSNAATPGLLAQSAPQGAAAWAADTAKTLGLAVPQRIASSGIYWAACMVAAATVPTLVGTIGAKPVLGGEGNLAVTSGSALAALAAATLAAPTFNRTVPLAIAS